jgi:hypothetical protein
LGISKTNAERSWAYERAWLQNAMSEWWIRRLAGFILVLIADITQTLAQT